MSGVGDVFSVTRGIGEMDVNQPPSLSSLPPVDDSCPYLILDVRDRDEYDACHLITGKCRGCCLPLLRHQDHANVDDDDSKKLCSSSLTARNSHERASDTLW